MAGNYYTRAVPQNIRSAKSIFKYLWLKGSTHEVQYTHIYYIYQYSLPMLFNVMFQIHFPGGLGGCWINLHMLTLSRQHQDPEAATEQF